MWRTIGLLAVVLSLPSCLPPIPSATPEEMRRAYGEYPANYQDLVSDYFKSRNLMHGAPKDSVDKVYLTDPYTGFLRPLPPDGRRIEIHRTFHSSIPPNGADIGVYLVDWKIECHDASGKAVPFSDDSAKPVMAMIWHFAIKDGGIRMDWRGRY